MFENGRINNTIITILCFQSLQSSLSLVSRIDSMNREKTNLVLISTTCETPGFLSIRGSMYQGNREYHGYLTDHQGRVRL